MRTNPDFTPLARSTIGFDHLFDLIESAGQRPPAETWPPYDVLKRGEEDYRIVMAVAGFAADDLTIVQEPKLLVIAGAPKAAPEGDYLYRGIAQGAFERRFELADHVRVASARLADGLLVVDLHRELPEEMKPRRIEIGRGGALPKDGAGKIAGAPKKVA